MSMKYYKNSKRDSKHLQSILSSVQALSLHYLLFKLSNNPICQATLKVLYKEI